MPIQIPLVSFRFKFLSGNFPLIALINSSMYYKLFAKYLSFYPQKKEMIKNFSSSKSSLKLYLKMYNFHPPMACKHESE